MQNKLLKKIQEQIGCPACIHMRSIHNEYGDWLCLADNRMFRYGDQQPDCDAFEFDGRDLWLREVSVCKSK